ncbi:MAG: hypothetical protein KQI78_15510 [Deltaproteobacteria bacterium]|jgi:hypothetical protein|nr:hypothetical protein [Deltaproteobacteria bacterium]
MKMKPDPVLQVWATDVRMTLRGALVWILFAIMAGAGASMIDRPAIAAEVEPLKVVGRWQRTDGGYILELTNPTFDGRLTAAYFNPRPINVSRSGWVFEQGNLLVLVELRDQGYPGSTYTLAYQPDTDRLVGIYFQAAAQQQFEVMFQRIE